MARTEQKRIKFSKGQVAPELIERTDLDLYNSSAQEIKNLISTVYGGVRTRRGLRYTSDIYSSTATGSVTNNIGGTTENIQNLDKPYVSGNLGTKRDLITIDYGETIVGANFRVKNILCDFLKLKETMVNSSLNLPVEGKYRIICVGAGGTAVTTPVYDDRGYLATGGSGSAFDGEFNLPAGNYPITVGRTDGGLKDSSFGNIVRAYGGGNGTPRLNAGQGGREPAYDNSKLVNKIFSSRGNGGKSGTGGKGSAPNITLSGGEPVYDGYGTGGGGSASEYDWRCSTYAPTSGYVACGLAEAKILVQTSDDGIDYITQAIYNIGTKPEDISVELQSFKYVKLVLDVDSRLNLTGKLHFDYIRVNTNNSSEVKLIPYIFNNEQEYIIALLNKRIGVYQNGRFIQEIQADAIKPDYIKDIKYTAKDDTIILTHPKMHPMEIKRTPQGFAFSTFDYVDIPVFAFGGETKTEFTTGITPSALEGAIKITADGSIFTSDWVGQKIDGNGGVVRITEYVSGTVVNGVTIIPFYTTDKVARWVKLGGYEPVWSERRGYPRTCLFAQQRLWFGGSKELPAHIWASRLNDYNNFKNAGNYANDSIDVTLLTNNPILNMIEQRGIHVFTSGEEWTASEGSLTPDDFAITKNTANGSKNITPVIIGGVVMFVEKTGKSLLGYVYNYEQSSFVTDNMSIFSKLVENPVSMAVETNSNVDRGDFLFMVLESGIMLTACVSINENIFSISRFETQGKVKDVCCLTSDTYVAVERLGKLYLERLSNDKTDQTQEFYVNGTEIPNMDEYEGRYVYVSYDDVIDKLPVFNGHITLKAPYTGYVTAGLGFDYKLQSNPIAINNKTTSCKKRISKATLVCKDTRVLTFNGQTKRDDFTYFACTKYDTDVRFEITGEYYPIEVLSLTLDINYEG